MPCLQLSMAIDDETKQQGELIINMASGGVGGVWVGAGAGAGGEEHTAHTKSGGFEGEGCKGGDEGGGSVCSVSPALPPVVCYSRPFAAWPAC